MTEIFQENPIGVELSEKQRKLLNSKICDLALKIPETRLEGLIRELYRELERAGISFRPKTYLSDEWGCPHGVPVIGIPFYLASAELSRLEGELSGIEAEDEAEVMMYLRHETGHTINYAYHLFRKPEWRRLFGKYSKPYNEVYKPVPFSAKYVRHIPGWYAQKHPDEDFAETFAVWLTPGSDWQKQYRDTPALEKLKYVDKIVKIYGRKPPIAGEETLDKPVDELKMTLDSWYDTNKNLDRASLNLHSIINEDLVRLFPETEGQAAAGELKNNSRQLIRDVNYWTGIDRHILATLFEELVDRVSLLGLKITPQQTTPRMISVAIFLTTLVMNYQYKGQFIES